MRPGGRAHFVDVRWLRRSLARYRDACVSSATIHLMLRFRHLLEESVA
jgi:hypothetical protein